MQIYTFTGLLRWYTVTGDTGSSPGLGRSPGLGNGNLFCYSCLGKSHGQRHLAGYSLLGFQRIGNDSAIKYIDIYILSKNYLKKAHDQFFT